MALITLQNQGLTSGILSMNELFGDGRNLRSDILFTFAIGLACYVAWLVRDVVVLLYVSGLLAVVFRPVVVSVSRLRVGRWRPFKGVAILVMLLAFAGALTAFGFLAFPPVIRDLQEFGREMPTRSPALLEKLRHIPFVDRMDTDDINSKIQDFASNAAAYLLLSFKSLASRLLTFISGLVLTIYFILEGDQAYRWFLSFFLPESRDRLDRTLQRAKTRMGNWLLGQASLMLVLGITSTLVYLALHLRYAYALGALTGLLNVIPVIGASVSIVLALLVAAIDSWGRVLGVAIFYAVYLQIENSFLVPHIMRQRVGLPGLAILVALLLGFELAGVMGILFPYLLQCLLRCLRTSTSSARNWCNPVKRAPSAMYTPVVIKMQFGEASYARSSSLFPHAPINQAGRGNAGFPGHLRIRPDCSRSIRLLSRCGCGGHDGQRR